KTQLDAPRMTEYLFGVERELPWQFALGLDVVHRRFNNQYEDIETNAIWDPTGNRIIGYKNGVDGMLVFDLETPDDSYRNFTPVIRNGRKQIGRAKVFASWAISKNEGTRDIQQTTGVATQYRDRRPQDIYYFGPTADDRRHNIKVQLSYDVTDSLLLGLQYQ